jgi:hypothetical protein
MDVLTLQFTDVIVAPVVAHLKFNITGLERARVSQSVYISSFTRKLSCPTHCQLRSEAIMPWDNALLFQMENNNMTISKLFFFIINTYDDKYNSRFLL